MPITLDLPEFIEKLLRKDWPDLQRKALEALALEAYRQEVLSRENVGQLLGLNFWETEAFLKRNKAYLHYEEEDLETDLETIRRLEKR